VQQQITRHLNDLRLRSQHVYPLLNQQPRNTPPPVYQLQHVCPPQNRQPRHTPPPVYQLQHVCPPSNRQPRNTSLSSTSSLSSRATATIFLHACHDPSTRPRTTSQFCKSPYLRLHQNRTLSAKTHPLTSKFKICQRILLLLQTLRKPLQSNQLL
jgi:hypothetical protein